MNRKNNDYLFVVVLSIVVNLFVVNCCQMGVGGKCERRLRIARLSLSVEVFVIVVVAVDVISATSSSSSSTTGTTKAAKII